MRSNEKMGKNHLHKMTLVSFSHAPPLLLCIVCVIEKKHENIKEKFATYILFSFHGFSIVLCASKSYTHKVLWTVVEY